jgi:hypothetical protein
VYALHNENNKANPNPSSITDAWTDVNSNNNDYNNDLNLEYVYGEFTGITTDSQGISVGVVTTSKSENSEPVVVFTGSSNLSLLKNVDYSIAQMYGTNYTHVADGEIAFQPIEIGLSDDYDEKVYGLTIPVSITASGNYLITLMFYDSNGVRIQAADTTVQYTVT